MYSDMSMRIIAFSSSKRNSASARASSVLPTPVGPRKMNEPIGRFGSDRPGASPANGVGTAATASSCPTTRWRSRVSIWRSFWLSASSIRVTGMPVHLRDDLGDVFLVDLFLEHGARRPAGSASASSPSSRRSARARGASRNGAPTAFSRSPARSASSASAFACSISSLSFRISPIAFFSFCQLDFELRDFSFSARRAPARWPSGAPCAAGPFPFVQRLAARSRAARSRRSICVDLGRAANRSPCGARRPPRRSGRSPCRAGTGR